MEKEIEKEYERIEKCKVWKPVPIEDASKDIEALTSAWAFKKKLNSIYRRRLNTYRFIREG